MSFWKKFTYLLLKAKAREEEFVTSNIDLQSHQPISIADFANHAGFDARSALKRTFCKNSKKKSYPAFGLN